MPAAAGQYGEPTKREIVDMRHYIIAIGVASVLLCGLTTADLYAGSESGGTHDTAAKLADAKCPVSGKPIDLSVRTMAKDGPVYFCCEDCVKPFKVDPGKYAAKVAEQRKVLRSLPRVQVSCPVSGDPIDKDVSIEHDGQKVYFCCKGCIPKYRKDHARYKARQEAGYTYQTRCPVMGDEIDPTAYVDFATGQRIYFCCKGCDKKFLATPAKYVAKLEVQGIKLDPAKVKRAEPGRPKVTARSKSD